MKTALCFYGQPRDAQVKSRQIIENIIEPNNCDVFFHTWYDNDDLLFHKLTPGHERRQSQTNIDKFLIEVYKPKAFLIQKQKHFFHKNFQITQENFDIVYPWAQAYDKKVFMEDRGRCAHSMWYSVMNAIMLKEMHSNQNNFFYDCVILSRFDVAPSSAINVSQYDLKNVIVRNYDYPRDEVSDWFLFSNNKNMNIVGSTFLSLEKHYETIMSSQNKIWNNESWLREQLKAFGIKSQKGNFDVTF